MTWLISKAITTLLSDGLPRTTEQLMHEIGLTRYQVLSAVTELSRRERISKAPITYTITATGKKYANSMTTTSSERMRKSRAREAKREAADERKKEAAAKAAVSNAIRSKQDGSFASVSWL